MSYSALRLSCLSIVGLVSVAQIGVPRQQPRPGTEPGKPMPPLGSKVKTKTKSGKKKVDESKVMIEGLRGTLRKVDDQRVILFTDDRRFVEIEREDETRFLKDRQDAMMADFVPGAKIWIEGYRDEDGVFHALRVNWEGAPTEAERVAAMGPVPQTVRFEDDRPAAEIAKETPKKDAPPKMTRKSDPKPAESSAPAPAAETATTKTETPAEAEAKATLVLEKPEDLIAAPKVKRGRPAERRRDPLEEDAFASTAATPVTKPSSPVTPAVEVPKEKPAEEDALIAKAREIALDFAETLPNYLAKQVTTRFVGNGKKDRWDPVDTFTADVVYDNGHESYRNVLLNGKPAKGKIEQTGSWSRGEFGTTLRDLMSMGTNAKFKLRGITFISNRKAKHYDYVVEQENSHWQIGVPGQTYFPAYTGRVWVDMETARVMRIEMEGRNIPSAFPVYVIESVVEWDFVKIGSSSYLVPVHAESLSCLRAEGQCSKNIMDFRNYRKFGAQSELITEPPQ